MSIIDSNGTKELEDSNTEDESGGTIKKSWIKKNNRCADITAKKYQKEVIDRRRKVNNLLMKGYSQQEILSKLHLSQPTAS
jgi:hypothetical protein